MEKQSLCTYSRPGNRGKIATLCCTYTKAARLTILAIRSAITVGLDHAKVLPPPLIGT